MPDVYWLFAGIPVFLLFLLSELSMADNKFYEPDYQCDSQIYYHGKDKFLF